MAARFGFYEVVRVVEHCSRLGDIAGKEAVVLGMAQNEETGRWGYAVHVSGPNSMCYYASEEELESAGRFVDRSTIYPDPPVRVKVRVDKDGRGTIVD